MKVQFPMILDGATGTQLLRRGFAGGQCTEAWVLEHPEVILELQRAYVEAGSRIVYAPTFGANRIKLEQSGIYGKVEEFNLRLVELSKQAVGGRAFVAGDISATGKFIAPLGNYTFEQLYDVYAEQAAALEKAGADLFVIETMMTLADARAAVLAVKSVSRKPVFVSFTCDQNGRTMTGTDVTAALAVMQGMGVDAFGLNCSSGPEQMVESFHRMAELAAVPLIAKPNAGIPEVVDGQTVYTCGPEEFTVFAEEMAACGVSIFGGCCGTGPEHIAALRERLAGITPAEPGPKTAGQLLCATERDAFLLPADTAVGTVIPCTESIMGDIRACRKETLITIEFTNEDELEYFVDAQMMIRRPLCIRCEDAGLLEKALRLYQGRALYDGSLPESELLPLSEKYGLVF